MDKKWDETYNEGHNAQINPSPDTLGESSPRLDFQTKGHSPRMQIIAKVANGKLNPGLRLDTFFIAVNKTNSTCMHKKRKGGRHETHPRPDIDQKYFGGKSHCPTLSTDFELAAHFEQL